VHIAAHEVQRDYSIASIPEERALHLLVRMRRADDGTSGRGSQWLGQTLSIGSIVLLHIRSNPGFHLLDTPCPALFIGNGTGIAGLRALLKQRHARGHMKNWLVYGERQAAVDQHFGDELKMWLEQGKLERLDLAFSRDSEPRYVADVLRQDASHVERWISQGACIYVCGTRNGMANDVDHALQDILSPHQYEQLKATGRYRRDVY
jgi:sulfite reductase (NADPH) flavoprotein alpha-component